MFHCLQNNNLDWCQTHILRMCYESKVIVAFYLCYYEKTTATELFFFHLLRFKDKGQFLVNLFHTMWKEIKYK